MVVDVAQLSSYIGLMMTSVSLQTNITPTKKSMTCERVRELMSDRVTSDTVHLQRFSYIPAFPPSSFLFHRSGRKEESGGK